MGLWLGHRRIKPDVVAYDSGAASLFGYYLASFLDLKGLKLATAQLERII
jgi:hypothetical protein